MMNGPRVVRAVIAPSVIRPLTGVGTVVTPNQREIRGLLAGERADMTYFVHPLALVGVTGRDVRLGHTGTPVSWNHWQAGKEPSVARLKGESALQRLLDGVGQSEVDDPRNTRYARGIESEGGVHIEGIDRQILRIRRLAYVIDEAPDGFRAAVQALANDLPELWKAANGIAADIDNSHSPVIQKIAQSLADQLDQLIRKLEGVDINTCDSYALVKMFDTFSWRMQTSFSAEGTSERLTIRTSPLLHETAYLLIDFLKTNGRIIRADEEGHGVIFQLDIPEVPIEVQKDEGLFLNALGSTFWTRKSAYTRAEFAAVLRLLGWGMMADQAQTVEVLRGKNGEALKDRSGLIYLTKSKPLPAIYVRLDFSAGAGLPEVSEPAA